ncbi:hypothetical protein ACROYT_G030385 [Oculina patagonica]
MLCPHVVTLQEVKDATAADETLQSLARVLATQKWPEARKDVSQYQQIKQELITPEWPRANGEAERLMKTLEKTVWTAVIQAKNWKQELFNFLRQYNATPHSTTGKFPSELLNGRKLKSTLPLVQFDQASPEIRQADAKRNVET